MRARINDRKRNAEFRYLLNLGLEFAGLDDASIRLPTENLVKSTTRIDHECYATVLDRCARFQRPVGRELVRLVAFAIQVSTNRDLALIAEMMQKQGSTTHVAQAPAQPGLQPATPA